MEFLEIENLNNQKIFDGFKINKNIMLINYPFYKLLELNPGVPYIQRPIDDDRVEKYFNTIKNHYELNNEIKFLNPIHIAVCTGNKFLILDGQHRFLAYQKIYEEKKFNFKNHSDQFFNVLLILYYCKTENEMINIFNGLNDYYYTSGLILSEEEIDKTNNLSDYFHKKYGCFYSRSKRPRFPNVCFEELVKKLREENPNKNSNQIINDIENENQRLSVYLEKEYKYDFNIINDKIHSKEIYEKKYSPFYYSYNYHEDLKKIIEDEKIRKQNEKNMK